MGVSRRGLTNRGTLDGHEPTGGSAEFNPAPSPFGGPGGLSGERPPVDEMSDEEMDDWAEECYNRSIEDFELATSLRKPRRKRRPYDYITKNCEEALGGYPA